VREGSFKAPKDRPLKNKAAAPSFGSYGDSYGDNQGYGSFSVLDDPDSELPF
jgi:hypothetical protein